MKFPRGKKMGKLQALLITGLLSLTSVSFATSVSCTTSTTVIGDAVDCGIVASGAQAGTITLDDDGQTAIFGGWMGGEADQAETTWYELNVNFSGTNSYGRITNSTLSNNPTLPN